ncbi:MAG: hypothetical protein Q4G09_01690 [Clostridia bacterium]|nr:hypothetical protein [Clostridia bacterium]
MENLEINSRKLELLKRSNILLEETKSNYKKYYKERQILLELTRNKLVNYEQWEHILKYFEDIVELDNILKLKESDFIYLKSLANFLRDQKTREVDLKYKYDKIIFKVLDINNNVHLFLTRNSAQNYIINNKSLFNDDVEIYIVNNKNDELEHLLDLIVRNF